MRKYWLLGSLVFFLLCSCQETAVKNQNSTSQMSPSEPKSLVENCNDIIKKISNFNSLSSELDKYFYVYKNVANIDDAEYIVFGEFHDDSEGLLKIFTLMNQIIEEGDAILVEKSSTIKIESNRQNLEYVLKIFDALKLKSLTEAMAMKDQEKMKAAAVMTDSDSFNIFWKTLDQKVKDKYNFDKLNFSKASFFGWDLDQGQGGGLDVAAFKQRNASFCREAQKARSQFKRVLINAGTLHVPHFDFAYALSLLEISSPYFGLPNAYKIGESFYKDIARYLPKDNKAAFAGLSEDIFKFLKENKSAVLIPKNFPNAPGLEATERMMPKNSF